MEHIIPVPELPHEEADSVYCKKCERRMDRNDFDMLHLDDSEFLCVACFENTDFNELRKLSGSWPSDKKRISNAIAHELEKR